jgi:hypothetical protein
MRSHMLLSGVLLAVVLGSPARGDLPGPHRYRPGPPIPVHRENAVPVVITARKDVSEARLVIPRHFLKVVQSADEHADIEGAIPPAPFTSPALPAVLAALVLAGAGLFLLRGRVRVVVAALMLLVLGVSFGGGRNRLEAAPPPTVKALLPAGIQLKQVVVEITSEGDTVELILPRKVLSGWKGGPVPPSSSPSR